MDPTTAEMDDVLLALRHTDEHNAVDRLNACITVATRITDRRIRAGFADEIAAAYMASGVRVIRDHPRFK
jgi:NAD-dependent oxidoreductase involved in siderophore biosynthesis